MYESVNSERRGIVLYHTVNSASQHRDYVTYNVSKATMSKGKNTGAEAPTREKKQHKL